MSGLKHFSIRAFFIFALFVSLTGGAFFLKYEALKSIRDLHFFLTLGFLLGGAFAARRLYLSSPGAFPRLSAGPSASESAPVKNYRKIFGDFYRALVILCVLFLLVPAARPPAKE